MGTQKYYYVEKVFEHKGLTCVVVLQATGHRCGYVGVPKEHKFYGKPYIHIEGIDVHGGLTYSGADPYYPIESKDIWWLGFDCAHLYDGTDEDAVMREMPDSIMYIDYSKYDLKVWTQKDVEEECRYLADQLVKE